MDPIPVTAYLPPLGERVQVYVARHDQLWTFARLIDPEVWEIDSRELPSHVAVASELVTHWRCEPDSPLNAIDEEAAAVVDAVPLIASQQRSLGKSK
jgi:hypothetical protein